MSQTILVVDDSQTIRKVVDMALKVAPLGVIEAETAAEALQLVDEDPRVALVDYHLPDASGYEVCEKLKTQLDAPVIMIAGQRHGFDQQRAKQSGADDVIPKPFDTDTLLDAIVGATGLEKRDMVKRLGDAGPDTGERSPGGAEAGTTSGSQAGQQQRQGSQSGARRPSPESGSKPRFQPAARSEQDGSRSGSSAESQPRMRTPDQDDQSGQRSGSNAGGEGGSKPRFQPGDRGGSQSGAESGARRADSGASSPGGATGNSGGSQAGQSAGEQEGPDIDIDLESSADHKAEPDDAGAPGGSGSKPVTTPESQAGGGSAPADVGGGSAAAGTSGGNSAQAPAGDTGGDSRTVSEEVLESDEFKSLIREQVKETVREQLPKLMRKLMGDIFQKKVLPKLIDHTDERIDKLFDEKLGGEVQQVVRQEIDRMLQEE